MQKDKTLQFWDDFYRSEQSKVQEAATATTTATTTSIKEWIVQPSDELFRLILNDLFNPTRNDDHGGNDNVASTKNNDNVNSTTYKILEIGCGTSLLSDAMCNYWEHHVATPTKKLHVIATDVSPVCIEQQIHLQQSQQQLQHHQPHINGDCRRNTTLEYQVLNITESHPELMSQFDMILDKGCFDTCLFRSKNTEHWIDTVLNNIHSWLKVDPGGTYTIITPRSKIKHVRDYIGFVNNVTRTILNESQYGSGALEPRSGGGATTTTVLDMKEARQYMYTCRRRRQREITTAVVSKYINVQQEQQQQSREADTAIDIDANESLSSSICTICGVSYDSFCTKKGSKVSSTDTKYWNRRWGGHLQHCKGN